MLLRLEDAPLLGLETEFPDVVWALKHPPTEKWGCYKWDGIHGLAVFSAEHFAVQFAGYVEEPLVPVEMSFDEARRVAQERPMPIVAVLLCDDLNAPKVHYVR